MTSPTAVLNAPRHQTTLSRGLVSNEWFELGLLPEFGCHWSRLRLSVKGEWVDLLKPVADGDALLDRPTSHGSYILAPWSNRIPNGVFHFEGSPFDIVPNFNDGSAIHGDVRVRPWNVEETTESYFEASLDTADFDDFNYPFALRFRHSIEAAGNSLLVGMTIENAEAVRVPVGLGYHPFLLRRLTWRDDDVIVQVPAAKVYPAERCIPTGPAEPVSGPTDLRPLRSLGARDLDHCFTELEERRIRVIYPGSRVEVRIEFDESFSHVVVYAPNLADGSAASFVAVEPVTHANDGFNLRERGWTDTGVRILEPGEAWTTSWSLSVGDL